MPSPSPIVWFVDLVQNLFGEQVEAAHQWVMDFLGAVVEALAGVAGAVIDLLPDMPDLGIPNLAGWVPWYDWLNAFLPLTETLAVFGLWLVIANAGFLWRVGVTVYHLIPKPFVGT